MKAIIAIIIIIIIVFIGFLFLRPGDSEVDNISTGSLEENLEENSEVTEQDNDFDKVPEFSLTDIDGNSVSLNDFEDKILVINSWATWCPFCVDELPDFAELQKEFGDEIVMIAINRRESLSNSKGFTDNLGITEDLLWLLDSNDSFYRSIGGFSMPETIFVDKDKNIRVHKRGPMELSEMISKVNSIKN